MQSLGLRLHGIYLTKFKIRHQDRIVLTYQDYPEYEYSKDFRSLFVKKFNKRISTNYIQFLNLSTFPPAKRQNSTFTHVRFTLTLALSCKIHASSAPLRGTPPKGIT